MTTIRNQVRAFMRAEIQDEILMYENGEWSISSRYVYLDSCGIANLTTLAENAAHYVEHDEWLDDSDHWVWEEAVDIADAMGVLG